MANLIKVGEVEEAFKKILSRAFQSGSLNFLLGSGASMPAISVAGNIEMDIQKYFESDKDLDAYKLIHTFLSGLQIPNASLIDDVPMPVLPGETAVENAARNDALMNVRNNYKHFISLLERILNQRKTNILPKQTNIFTTNYDVFIEKAAEEFTSLKINDGFTRIPSLKAKPLYAPQNFFNSLYNNGNLYSYKVEIPAINLIKLHGSLTWKKEAGSIHFDCSSVPVPDDINLPKLKAYADAHAVILPQKGKFRETIMDRTYYDLLRLYANELDKENTLLVAFGFSFGDEHIFDITKRALKNPTLKLIVFAFNKAASADFLQKFDGHSNVDIVEPSDGEVINFESFNTLLSSVPYTYE